MLNFTSKLQERRRAANLAAKLARSKADLPSEDAELLLSALGGAPEGDAAGDAGKRKTYKRTFTRSFTAKSFRGPRGGQREPPPPPRSGGGAQEGEEEGRGGALWRWMVYLTSRETYLPEAVDWAIRWTFREHRRTFLRALVLVCYSSLYMGAIPVMMNYLFSVALPGASE